MERFDACVIGHVVRDMNVIDGIARPPQPGGAAFYSTMVYARLGLRTAVVTRVAPADEPLLLGELRAFGVHVLNLPTIRTTIFHNIDSPTHRLARVQRVDCVAGPILAAEMPPLGARIWQLGPLAQGDLDLGLVQRCRRAGGRVALDVQGLIRRIADGRVQPAPPDPALDLAGVDVLKADDTEILTFTGLRDVALAAQAVHSCGPREVLVTKADRGSTIFAGAAPVEIAPFRPRAEIDPTGCGDTYLAAYLARRLENDDVRECGDFASAVAGIKLEASGPFRGTSREVAARRLRSAC